VKKIFIGVDLAASASNTTGICVLEDNIAIVRICYQDSEIFDFVNNYKPEIIAFDAPLTRYKVRKCDKELKWAGILSPKLLGMRMLTERAILIKNKLKNYNIIEVFPTVSAKILSIYNKNRKKYIANLCTKLKLKLSNRITTKDEIDAVVAAYTAKLYALKFTNAIGDKRGTIIVPKSYYSLLTNK